MSSILHIQQPIEQKEGNRTRSVNSFFHFTLLQAIKDWKLLLFVGVLLIFELYSVLLIPSSIFNAVDEVSDNETPQKVNVSKLNLFLLPIITFVFSP